jgi:hypothetical protein
MVRAAEFYSWIEPSGTMVMTDDPSSIPPSVTRSPVSIHRFEDPVRSRADVTRRQVSPVAQQPSGEESTDGLRDTGRDAGGKPRGTNTEEKRTEPDEIGETPESDDSHDPILLEAPEDTVRREYLWVPLLAPVYVGTSHISGFWCHRSVSSPVAAFKTFLAQHGANSQVLIAGGQLQLGNLFKRPGSSRWSRTRAPIAPGGTSVYDQVLREQRALIDRATAPFRSSGGRGPQGASGGGGRHGRAR